MILSDHALPTLSAKATHAVDILAFVEAQEVPPLYFETPYRLTPAPGDEMVYALLRDTLRCLRKVGIAYVVIQSRQHLAAVIPRGQALVLNTLRWNHESTGPLRLQGESLEAGQLEAMIPPRTTPAPLTRQHEIMAKKTERIVVEELDSLFDEDLFDEDDDPGFTLRHKAHPADGNAVRRKHLVALWPRFPRTRLHRKKY